MNLGAMTSPVRCNYCGEVYDLGAVTPTARYSDCTCFVTPCCQHKADDREWVGSPSFSRNINSRMDVFGVWR